MGTSKRAEWIAMVEYMTEGVEIKGTNKEKVLVRNTLPALVYDKFHMPCGYILFTTKAKSDHYLEFNRKFKAEKRISLKLGVDCGVIDYETLLVKTVNNILRAHGKELDREQLSQLAFYGMPVFYDLKRPLLGDYKVAFECLMDYLGEFFTMDLIYHQIEGAKGIDVHGIGVLVPEFEEGDDHFIAITYKREDKFFTICIKTPRDIARQVWHREDKDKEKVPSFLYENLKEELIMRKNVLITRSYDKLEETIPECNTWMEGFFKRD